MDNRDKYTDYDGRVYSGSNDSCSYGSDKVIISDEALGFAMSDTGKLKKTSSRIHLSLFIYIIITNAIVFAVSIGIGIILRLIRNEELMEFISSPMFSIILSSVAQYLIAFPIFIAIAKSISKPQALLKSKMGLGELSVLLLISEGLMLVGSIAGSYVSQLIGNIFGISPDNSLDAIISETPVWLIFISVVILAPLVEEIIYRKIIIDRLGHFGDVLAIIISAVTFALMHCNLYQFFYALGVGIVFGYVYVRTHDVRYTIAMHMILNFIGSIVTLPVAKAQSELMTMMEIIAAGGTVDRGEYIINQLIVYIYSSLQMTLMAGGIIALVLYVYMKKVRLNISAKPKGTEVKAAFFNVGAILFIGFCLALTAMNLLIGA
jgi:membrane protease YdiL (CAAX protease family)